MRCRACNCKLDNVEMSRDVEYNGMCRSCVGKSDPPYIYTRDREYEHQNVTDSLSHLVSEDLYTNNDWQI